MEKVQQREILLKVTGLTTKFDDFSAVDDISFELNYNETVGIVGESGSGKSVTALSIMGLVDAPGRIEAGEILYHHNDAWTDLVKTTDREMRRFRGKHIGLIFQEPFSAFNPSMTCGRQIMESVELHMQLSRQDGLDHIYQILRKVGVADPHRLYNSYPHQLSGGQLQRALIAMAVVCHPRIIIADEPTTALDVTVQKSVLKLFKDICSENDSSMLFISHDLGVISEIADRVLVMYKGKVVEAGEVSEVFNKPRHPYTRGLLECRPRLDRKVSRLPVISDFLDPGSAEEKYSDIGVSKKTADHSSNPVGQPLLEVKDLDVRYPKKKNFWGSTIAFVHAVQEVSFDIYPRQTIGLVGESGSGKSSLGKAILKLEESSGKIVYNGVDISHFSQQQMRPVRKKMQIVFQDPYSTLNPRMKIGEAIKEVLTVHSYRGNKDDRVSSLLHQVGLDPSCASRYPRQFSGGQRQRISIARTLAVEPEFVVCDESVSALDVSVQAQILNLLKDLQDELGLSYLFISHDLSVVKHMSDRILVMKDGQIVEEGSPDEIYHEPKHEYTRQLIAAIPGQ